MRIAVNIICLKYTKVCTWKDNIRWSAFVLTYFANGLMRWLFPWIGNIPSGRVEIIFKGNSSLQNTKCKYWHISVSVSYHLSLAINNRNPIENTNTLGIIDVSILTFCQALKKLTTNLILEASSAGISFMLLCQGWINPH